MLRARIAGGLSDARRAAGLSMREVAAAAGASVDTISRLERGEPGASTLDRIAKVAEVVGLELAASPHPNADPVRDRGHLALLARLRTRLAAGARLRMEVPIPIAGDLRSGDALLEIRSPDGRKDALIEAETHVDDIQLIERRGAAKQRDLGASRLVLLVADTRHNRRVIRAHPELCDRFPVCARAALRALSQGDDPGGDCLIVL